MVGAALERPKGAFNFLMSNVGPLIVFGAGGHGAAVIDAARHAGFQPQWCVDDSPDGESVLGVVVRAAGAFKWPKRFRFVAAIGDCIARRDAFQRMLALGGAPFTIIHPRAHVSGAATVGPGSVVLPMSAIDPRVAIGANVIVNLGAIIGHDCLVESHAHISGNVSLAGGTHVGEGAWVGIHSCTIQHVKIGAWSFVGAGSCVTRDIPPGVQAFGSPAHRNLKRGVMRT